MISFGNVHMNGGSVLLRIFTERRSWGSRPKAAVSRSVRVGESGSTEAGVFKIWCPAFRFRTAAPAQDLQTIGPLRLRTPRPKGLDPAPARWRSEEHTSELQSHVNLVCRLLLE